MKEARRSGVKFGRKAKLSFARIVKARKLIERAEDVAALWNVSRATLYRPLSLGSMYMSIKYLSNLTFYTHWCTLKLV
jgi:hypothetical protein